MPTKCVVLDFDGTFSDIDTEAAPFPAAFRTIVADLFNEDLREAWKAEEAKILAKPEDYGWEYESRVVAPATADPYLLCTAIVQGLFDARGRLRNPALRTAITQHLYGLAYERTLTAFKPDAAACLNQILDKQIPTFVVTNSRTDVVAKKLDQLNLPRRKELTVIGEAKKFWVTPAQPTDPRFDALAEFEKSPRLGRPIYLRRGKYFEALAKIWQQSGATPAETAVFGDIYELDLALPAALGCKILLARAPRTLPYEEERVTQAKGHVVQALKDLPPLL